MVHQKENGWKERKEEKERKGKRERERKKKEKEERKKKEKERRKKRRKEEKRRREKSGEKEKGKKKKEVWRRANTLQFPTQVKAQERHLCRAESGTFRWIGVRWFSTSEFVRINKVIWTVEIKC